MCVQVEPVSSLHEENRFFHSHPWVSEFSEKAHFLIFFSGVHWAQNVAPALRRAQRTVGLRLSLRISGGMVQDPKMRGHHSPACS